MESHRKELAFLRALGTHPYVEIDLKHARMTIGKATFEVTPVCLVEKRPRQAEVRIPYPGLSSDEEEDPRESAYKACTSAEGKAIFGASLSRTKKIWLVVNKGHNIHGRRILSEARKKEYAMNYRKKDKARL